MNTFQFALEHSPWFVLLCLAVGATYAYILYSKSYPWKKTTNYLLATLRFSLVTILCLLFLEPFMQKFINEEEQPVVAIAMDNSASVKFNSSEKERKKVLSDFNSFKKRLEEKGFQVSVEGVQGGHLDSTTFDSPYTNLTELLIQTQDKYEEKNLAAVVLFSDGIYNKGGSPLFRDYLFNIHTVAFGDTIEKSDISLKSLLYNKITYPNTIFPIHAEIKNVGFKGKNVRVQLKENGGLLEEKVIQFNNEKGLKSVEFNTSTEAPGLHRYTVHVLPLKGEYTTKNNYQTAYIEVIDGSQNILIAALTPHPDIKAIKLALKEKENINIDLYIPGIHQLQKDKQYDLVILHQLPNIFGRGTDVLNMISDQNLPTLFILGNQSNITQVSQLNPVVGITDKRKKDEVTAEINESFMRFTFHEQSSVLEKAPPLAIPYADITLKPGSEILFFQKIGTSITTAPLVAFNVNGEQKSGIILGEGIWQWRLYEYRMHENAASFDDLLNNMIQLLANKADNRKFLVETTSRQYDEDEPVTFVTEVYNDVMENIYGQDINLTLTHKESKKKFRYTYQNNKYQNKYQLTKLASGIYNYTAQTTLGGKTLSFEGEFVVRKTDIEAMVSLADHNMLKSLARETGGKFTHANNLESLDEYINKDVYKTRVNTTEERVPIIHLKWIFFLLMALATTEWATRKYLGSY